MNSLSDLDLKIPRLDEDDDSFQAIKDQDGLKKESVIIIEKAFNLLKEIGETGHHTYGVELVLNLVNRINRKMK